MLGRKLGLQNFAVANNDTQQVVEVVSHTSGQAAHGLELLDLSQLQLEALALGGILNHALVIEQFPFVAVHGPCALHQPSLTAIPALYLVFEVANLSLLG